MFNGVAWPAGLLPKMATQLPNMAIVRSVRAWALVHSLSQTWVQIGRNPAAALGNIAPNIGSVVAIEKEPERRAGQVFPTFLALNATNQAGPGYLSAKYAPFKLTPNVNNPGLGLPNTTNVVGASRIDDRWGVLHGLDDSLRIDSPLGTPVSDYEDFYESAKGLMYNSVVDKAFVDGHCLDSRSQRRVIHHGGVVLIPRPELVVGDRRMEGHRAHPARCSRKVRAVQGRGPGVEERAAVRFVHGADQVVLRFVSSGDIVVVLHSNRDAVLG